MKNILLDMIRPVKKFKNVVKILNLLKEQQKKEINELKAERENMRDKGEMYDDIYEKQQTLLKRAQDIVRLSILRLRLK